MLRALVPFAFAAGLLLGGTSVAVGQFAVGGVYVDADGMLARASRKDAPRLRERYREAVRVRSEDAAVEDGSPLRMVSLRRLEAEVERLRAAGKPLPADVRFLAGLVRVTHVFFVPQAGDVVLAGPAETWTLGRNGDVVGAKSGRPVLRLDDLIVALRYAFAERADAFVGCSIDPTVAGARRMAAFTNRLAGVDAARMPQVAKGMAQAMGPQAVRVFGVPAETGFGLQLVAADYRLKRLAMGHDPSPDRRVKSYLDLVASKRIVRRVAQHRFWFVGRYEAIHRTPDGRAWEFVGPGYEVATAPSDALQDDDRKPGAAASAFVTSFNARLEEITAARPTFAALENLIALTVAGELVAREREPVGADGEAWQPSFFLDAKRCAVEAVNAPRQVPSLANVRRTKRGQWVVSVSGGVEIDPRKLLGRGVTPEEAARELGAVWKRRTAGLRGSGRWWWD